MKNTYSPLWFDMFLHPIQAAQTQREADFIARQLPNPPYSKILDLCCGAGRHARELAARDYSVTAIDSNIAALAKAREHSSGNIMYIEHDIRRLGELSETFDAIICMWQSFGHFDEPTNSEILRSIAAKLNPDGRVILDIYHRDFFDRNQGVRSFERNSAQITETKRMTGNRLTVELAYQAGGKDAFEWQLWTPEEIQHEATRFGLRCTAACAGFDERQTPTIEQPRMQIVFELG